MFTRVLPSLRDSSLIWHTTLVFVFQAEPEDSRSDDDDPLPPPETERSETVRPNQGRRVELAEEMARKTEMDALKLENETLVIQNRKLELKIQGLVGELASLGNKYEELNQLLCR